MDPSQATIEIKSNLPEVHWVDIEHVLLPHATVANGRELHWISWCWQILQHLGLTSYGSEAEKAMVLMRALVLMRVHQDYAYIMLEIDQSLDEKEVFSELSAATGSTSKATLRWEHKRIMDVLIENYVEWDPLVSKYDPSLADEYRYTVHEFLDDLQKTLPPGDEIESVHPMLPNAYNYRDSEMEGVESLADYHIWLSGIREGHIYVWMEANWVLPNIDGVYEEGVHLFWHAEWDNVEPYFRENQCWGTGAEITWFREMWKYLQDSGYTGYRFEFEEVAETMVRLVYLYQSFCFLALDRPIAIKPSVELERITKEAEYFDYGHLEWERNGLVTVIIDAMFRAQRFKNVGRYGQRTIDCSTLFLHMMIDALPLADKSLVRHYEKEAAWRFDGPPGVDLKEYNASLFKERMGRIEHWLKTGELFGSSGASESEELDSETGVL